ncbi:MAG: hypothetical protein DHS20C09_06600 [marine bacterium B5-7]|nr:MAG: hypothetical protein DHS20C09_06600 [marine bacterium B5-7]
MKWRFEESGVDYGQLITGEYNYPIVILSILIACVAGYTGLATADRMRQAGSATNKMIWLAVGATAMGMGIWAMHFFGMIAFTVNMPVLYSIPLTILSCVPSIVGSAIALLLLSAKTNSWQRNQVSALCLATCIALMHYTGMEAMRMPSILKYDLSNFIFSIIVAHLLASLALNIKYISFNDLTIIKRYQNIISAVIMGLSVSGMHYTAMGATRLYKSDVLFSHDNVMSDETLLIPVVAITIILLIFVIVITHIDKNINRLITRLVTTRNEAEQALENRTQLLLHKQKVLFELSTEDFPDQETAFHKITKIDAEQLKVKRVSVWLYNQGRTKLTCTALYNEGKIVDEMTNFMIDDYPDYFQTLEEQSYISVNDARNDPSTKEFLENYLTPLGITSMLDVPIHFRGELVGIVCHEHVGPEREWTVEDKDFANSIADLCALVLAAEERKKTEEELSRITNLLKNVFDTVPNFIFVKDRESKFVLANKAVANAYGSTVEDIIGKSDADFNPNTKENDHFHKDDLDVIINKKEKIIPEEKITTAQGEIRWLQTIKRPLIEENGDVNCLLGISTDLTERKKADEKIQFQANHDALTGLVNRREFERRTERLLANIIHDKHEHALCYMDLDQFKVVNDTCGHIAGDELLRQLSNVLQKVVRYRDTIARLGGDEFGVLMEHCSLDDANRVAISLQKAIQDYQFLWDGQSFRVGVSIGLVAITKTTVDLTELLMNADAACYIAKDSGRNRVHIYRSNDNESNHRQGEMQWVNRIHKALDENRFCLYAQPIESLDNHTDTHYEILLRMIDEQGMIIPPGAFLPAAERYNLITQLDRWVIKKTLGLLIENPTFLEQIHFISINLSGQSLTDETFLDFVITQLQNLNINSTKICFEITETAAISNLANADNFISELKKYGCSFALDDFGSGLSSFGYLKNLPVDFLKIDGMFVKDIVDDPIDHAMVKSINEIGQVMGMKTIAEFVESDVIKGMLKEIGINFAQGYSIGKPHDFNELLHQHQNLENFLN